MVWKKKKDSKFENIDKGLVLSAPLKEGEIPSLELSNRKWGTESTGAKFNMDISKVGKDYFVGL